MKLFDLSTISIKLNENNSTNILMKRLSLECRIHTNRKGTNPHSLTRSMFGIVLFSFNTVLTMIKVPARDGFCSCLSEIEPIVFTSVDHSERSTVDYSFR
jgi:hypothetical protein